MRVPLLTEAEWCKIALSGDVAKSYARTELRKITPQQADELHCYDVIDGGDVILVERLWGYVGIGWRE